MSVELEQAKTEDIINKFTGGFINIGDKIKGYVITEKLNTDSGEAEIYFCEKNDKKYILKYYFKKNFYSDIIEKIKSINHPNVMNVYEIGTHNKHWYEIDEYYAGGSLDSALPLEDERAYEILNQLNEGLKAIHDAGIIHRDIKAENIYFTDSNKQNVVIGDFGISIVYDQKDGVNQVFTEDNAGTEGYRAPEVFNNIVSPSIDYYSLGITLWNLVEGREPFVEKSGEVLTSEVIRGKTINEEIKDFLFSNSLKSTDKTKKIISGLLTNRHDKRWTYNQIKDFLTGKDVSVYEEKREIKTFIFDSEIENPIEFHSLKGIAQELLNNPLQGLKSIKESKLTLYLDDIGFKDLSEKIEEVQEKFFESKATEVDGIKFSNDFDKNWYGLVKCAIILSKDIVFPIVFEGNKYEIDTLETFRDMLLEHPTAIRSYLLDESKGLYVMLEAKTLGVESTLCNDIKNIIKNANFDKFISTNIYLAITGNKIKPFTDKENANIELATKEDVFNLEQHLKDRLMYYIDSKNKLVVSWFENIFNVKLSDWYSELDGGFSHDERISSLRRNKLLAYGKWKYFELFLNGKDVVYRNYYFSNGKFGLLNLDGSILLKAEHDDVGCEFIRNKYIVKNNDVWSVFDINEQKTEMTYKNEVSVFDEVSEVYIAQHESENRHVFLTKSEKVDSPNEKRITESDIVYIKAYSERNRPNERIVKNGNELLDSNYSLLKKYKRLQVLSFEGEVPKDLLFWALDGQSVYLIDKNGNEKNKFDYCDFVYVGHNCFIVTNIEGKQSVVNYKNELIQDRVKEYKTLGAIAAIKEGVKTKWKIKNLKDDKWEYNGKKFKDATYYSSNLFVSKSSKKFYFFGNDKNGVVTTIYQKKDVGGKITNSKGLCKNFKTINYSTLLESFSESLDENNSPKDFSYSTLIGFDGDAFYKYNFENYSFEKITSLKYIPYDDYNTLMFYVDSKQIVSLVKRAISKKNQKKANEIINLVWHFYFYNNRFEVTRFLLNSIRMDDMEGLDFNFSYYKCILGKTYLKECQLLGRKLSDEPLKTNFALQYLFSACGMEIDDKKEIITAPYINKIGDIDPESLFECINLCIDISNLRESFRFEYREWTKDFLVKVATKFIDNLYDFYTEKDNIDSKTYIYIHKLGLLRRNLGNINGSVEFFIEGIAKEPDTHPINTVQLFLTYYGEKKYDEAIKWYKILEERYPYDLIVLEKSLEIPIKDIYYECRRKV